MNFGIEGEFCGKVTIIKRCKRSFSLQTRSVVCVNLTVWAISDVNCETFLCHELKHGGKASVALRSERNWNTRSYGVFCTFQSFEIQICTQYKQNNSSRIYQFNVKLGKPYFYGIRNVLAAVRQKASEIVRVTRLLFFVTLKFTFFTIKSLLFIFFVAHCAKKFHF